MPKVEPISDERLAAIKAQPTWKISALEVHSIIARLEVGAAFEKQALKRVSDLSREAGEAKGKLEMSEMAGIVEGWKDRALAAEEALKPFAAEAMELAPSIPDDTCLMYEGLPMLGLADFTVGDLRRARNLNRGG